jgi:hypothetical protein
LEEEFNRKLISPSESSQIFIDFDENELLRTNKQSTADYISKLVSCGVISKNEGRSMLGLNSVDGADTLTVAYSDIKQNSVQNDSDK